MTSRRLVIPTIVLLVISILCHAKITTEVHKCLTPNATQGICVNLMECKTIYKVANDYLSPITLETMQFLIKSQCGFNGTIPKVCCPRIEFSKISAHNVL